MLAKLLRVAERTKAVVLRRYEEGGGDVVVRRGDVDVTKAADAEAEEAALRALREEFPEGALVIAEESGEVRWGDERHVIYLDPLDGSENFFAGIPLFAVALAGGRYKSGDLADLEVAVIALPKTDEVFTASAEGVFLNGSPLPITDGSSVALVELGRDYPQIQLEIPRVLGLKARSLGCATYSALLAALGRVALFLDLRYRLGVWDVAPALVFGRHNKKFKAYVRTKGLRVSVVAGESSLADIAAARAGLA
ncbi:Archaeal fructose-1,6-bisphosphatase and related enzymes of inositol monophosphatase family [Pyrobaculum oguniense TE7]|uniref:Archaeal fructose-1,6-bisphosphatase and related enzymes of inositol monophosphatase family n=1 Tax=Pyrobaculum oguniense (strain DSM 13380 / JCM 10595 / TE7) TaxID=698757 RepID=H6Q9E6_PYROT|nr:Archaeal fructose-1,6-bisphosphatase and related enzymes of inositol monophosphatase family [Pyrobaculum oguniense TE7]